jgi:hypothetical protein
MLCIFGGRFYLVLPYEPEDGGSAILGIVSELPSKCMASHPRTQNSSLSQIKLRDLESLSS